MALSGPPITPEEELFLRGRVKDEIRRRIRAVRRKLPPEARAARSAAIAERVAALEVFDGASTLMAYVSIHGEADPGPLVEIARAAGKALVLPRVDLETGEVVLHRHREGDPLEAGAFGVPEPSAEAEVVPDDEVDLVLVPALAVDPRGHRIGYGKGFYDRLLPRLERATSSALIFDFQLISEAPNMPGDVPVDLVVTDVRLFDGSAAE